MAYFDTMNVPRVLMHQVEPAHVGIDDRRSLDRARIVDHDVDAAEGRDGPLDRAFDLGLVAHIDNERERMSAGLGDFVRGGEDRAGQFRMRLVGLGRDGDVGAVARGAQRNCKPMPRDAPVMNNVRSLSIIRYPLVRSRLSARMNFTPAPRQRR